MNESLFRALPLVVEGESKEVRYLGQGRVAIRLKPTIYSFTANRSGVVEGSDRLRYEATQIFDRVLREAGIATAYRDFDGEHLIADLVLQPAHSACRQPFRPSDVDWSSLDVAPPIEVVVKRCHSGTSKHRYHGMAGWPVRASHPFYAGFEFGPDDAYPEVLVRFDWRNPLLHPVSAARLADEILPDELAALYIDVERARLTARKIEAALSRFLDQRDIVIYDLCLFLTESGEVSFGEVSQDCGRFRHFDQGSLDKDVWRQGGSSATVLEKWRLLLDMIR